MFRDNSDVDSYHLGVGESVVTSQTAVTGNGLGSCVVVTLYHLDTGVGGAVHSLLPYNENEFVSNPHKFVDTGIEGLLCSLENLHHREISTEFEAKIVGGGSVHPDTQFNVGERNVKAAERTLSQFGIPICGQDTGGFRPRSFGLDMDTGTVFVLSHGSIVSSL